MRGDLTRLDWVGPSEGLLYLGQEGEGLVVLGGDKTTCAHDARKGGKRA